MKQKKNTEKVQNTLCYMPIYIEKANDLQEQRDAYLRTRQKKTENEIIASLKNANIQFDK